MTRFNLLTLTAITLAALLACGGTAPQQTTVNEEQTIADSDSTLYGSGETKGNALSLTCDNGKCLTLRLIDEGDTAVIGGQIAPTNVLGGLFVGDRLAVMTAYDGAGARYAKTVVNLTSLMGRWQSDSQGFTLEEGGTVSRAKGCRYAEWRMHNGRLILRPTPDAVADTFDIYDLTADTLFLENEIAIYGYTRQ